MKYVNEWPNQIVTSDGSTINPTPEQCREAGYELESNRPPPTAEEIAAEQAAVAEAEQQANEQAAQLEQMELARLAAIQAIRDSYKQATQQFCGIAGLPIADKLDTPDIEAAIQVAGTSPTALPLTQLAFKLYVTINELKKLDGEDAWDHI
jgi:hypothetical protein